jgi:hypothetical protein
MQAGLYALGAEWQAFNVREGLTRSGTLGNQGDPRDNGSVNAGQDWVDGWKAAWLL